MSEKKNNKRVRIFNDFLKILQVSFGLKHTKPLGGFNLAKSHVSFSGNFHRVKKVLISPNNPFVPRLRSLAKN